MLKHLLTAILQNKNIIMLLTSSIYVLALFATLSGNLLIISLLLSALMIVSIIKNYCPLKFVIIWTIIFYIGVINTNTRLKNTDELLNLAPINTKISGKIISIPQIIQDNKIRFFFEADNIDLKSETKELNKEKTLVTINSYDKETNHSDFKIYNTYNLKGRLSLPFKAGNPSQFDYGNYLRNHNTYSVFYANDYELMQNDLTYKEKFMQKVNDYREKIINTHSQYLKSPNLEILGGIVFGDDAINPSQEIKQSFINSGLLHILAASGMNVAFIYSFFFMLMSLIKIPFKIKVTTGMLMVIIYTLMTGLGASVIRAACMLIFVLIGKLIDRDAHSISLLSFVGLLMLLYNPMYVNDVGFQLSFIVTLGILLMTPASPSTKNTIINFIIGTITIPIIAQLWVIPIQIFYFNNISIYSIFANIMSVPILMIISFGGFISSLLSIITPISNFVCQIFDFVLNPFLTILVKISDFWGSLPYSTMQTTHPNILQILLYYGTLISLSQILKPYYRNKFLKPLTIIISSCLILLGLTLIPIKNNHLQILSFDVGNADCFLVKTPKNKYFMIDTGKAGYNGGKSQAKIIVEKYLKDKGIKNLEFIIVTHFDNDHCGGVVDLIKDLKVKKVYVNELNNTSTSAQMIYKTATENNTKIHLFEDITFNEKDLNLKNYKSNVGKTDNDNSIMNLLSYYDFSILFTGDAGINEINDILEKLPQNITVLKVPHHGAKGGLNKKILEYLNPKYSLISVGENKFGHPTVYTLNLLKNTTILRTDINNAILIDVDKNDYNIKTYDITKRKFL